MYLGVWMRVKDHPRHHLIALHVYSAPTAGKTLSDPLKSVNGIWPSYCNSTLLKAINEIIDYLEDHSWSIPKYEITK